MEELIILAATQYPVVAASLAVVGSVVSIATMIIKATPKETDDELLNKYKSRFEWLFKLADRFSVLERRK